MLRVDLRDWRGEPAIYRRFRDFRVHLAHSVSLPKIQQTNLESLVADNSRHAAHERNYEVQSETHKATNNRAVDPNELKIPANSQFQSLGHLSL